MYCSVDCNGVVSMLILLSTHFLMLKHLLVFIISFFSLNLAKEVIDVLLCISPNLEEKENSDYISFLFCIL